MIVGRMSFGLVVLAMGIALLGCSSSKEFSAPDGMGGQAGQSATPSTGGLPTGTGGSSIGGAAGSNTTGGSSVGGAAGSNAAECTSGATDCDGLTPLSCGEDGTWSVARGACAIACLDGACAECQEGALECLDGAVRRCRDGSWTTVEVCDVTCEDGACAESCQLDRLQCNGDTLQRCDGSQYVDDEDCEFLCQGGACIGECMPDAKRCSPEVPNEAESCDATGQWSDSVECDSGTFCVQGECKPCEPGSRRCAETGPQLCSEQGEWEPQGACSDAAPACVAGLCVTCSPGDRRCSGSALLECEEDGSEWTTVQTCSGSTPACLESIDACGQCSEGDTQCDGDVVQRCGSDGAWQVDSACAGATPQCVLGTCSACDPAVSERRCQDANTAQLCNAQASWGTTTACTGDTSTCRSDLNFSCGCAEGERRCRNGTVPEACVGGAWVAQSACSGALGYCLPDTGLCVACQPGQEGCQSGVARECTSSGSWASLSSCAGETVNCGGCDLGEPCDAHGDCTSNACVNDVCATCQPGAVSCANQTPRVCSSSGSWTNQTACSGMTPVCQGGACVACQNGNTRSCGNCDLGTETCSAGAWGACTGAPEDTLAAGGNTKVFAELSDPNDDYSADLAWSPASARYALVYVDNGSAAGTTLVDLALLSQNGTINANLVELGVGQVRQPAVAWGADNFGVTWIEGAPADADVMFTRVQGNGTYIGQDVSLQQGEVDSPRVGRFGSGDWFVVWRNFSEFGLLLEGQVPPPFQAGPLPPVWLSDDVGPRGEPLAFDAAASTSEFGLFYKSADAGFFSKRFDGSFNSAGNWPLTNAVGQNPRVTKTSDGYARAYVTTTGVAVERFVLGATASACHNANIEFGASNSANDGVAITATATGLAVLATRASSHEVGFFLLGNDCQVVRGPLTVSADATSPSLPRLAFGTSGFAAVWRERPQSNTHQGLVRTFSTDLCD